MKVISVSVSEEDYDEFREAAASEGRPIAQLIRDAMTHYRKTVLTSKPRLENLPVLVGHAPQSALPTRNEIYEETFESEPTP
jgi:hypothetical protein